MKRKDRTGKYIGDAEFTLEELNKLPKSRREAMILGERFYFNGNLCKYNHLSPRRTDSKCRECVTIRDNKRYQIIAKKLNKSKIRDITELTKSVKNYSKQEAISNNERYYFTNCSKCLQNEMLHDTSTKKAGCIKCIREYSRDHARKKFIPKPKKKEKYNTIENILFMRAKQRAKKKNLDFNIELSDIFIPEYCPILNTPIKLYLEDMSQSNVSRANSPSLDRIDSKKGYVKNNIIVISYRANIVKGQGTAIEHKKIAQWMKKKIN